MEIEWDHTKNARNILLRGLDFANVAAFDWDNASYELDLRNHYGELRVIATGFCEGRLTVLVFTPREGLYRIISWRRANKREKRRYENKDRLEAHRRNDR